MRATSILQHEVVEACRRSLEGGRDRRRAVTTCEQWKAWQAEVLETVKAPFPPAALARRGELKVRPVSAHEFPEFRLENVLFESLPDWEVNASVYLPKEPGIYPGVVCPTGHSTKTNKDYQQSAQVFARNGYVSASFDPPGCAGELAHLNDHFTNGLVGYLTGLWSQTHFVVDAVRCLDYLQTREDVDQEAGLVMTGVSGGGITSIFAALLDERVAFVAPVCCLAEHEAIHLQGLYTSCPEQFGVGYIAAGLDYVDYVAALGPRPCLLMAGEKDEVFDIRSTRAIAREAKRLYRAAGAPHACDLFVDADSGHAYTVAMASETVRWMNRVIKKSNAPALDLKDEDVELIPPEKLLCYPRNQANMFTLNQRAGRELRQARAPRPAAVALQAAAAEILGIEAEVEPLRVKTRSAPRRSWHVLVEEVEIEPEEEVRLPGLMLTHAEDRERRPALLWIDDRGRWAALRQNGFLVPALRMFEVDCLPDQPRILSMEVSGLGQLEPEPTAYDLASWNDCERILTYLALANGRPVMGLRVRDALCGLEYLRSRPEVDPKRIMVGGRGIGGIVALHAALLGRGVGRTICLEMLSHYGALTEQFPFTWQQSIIIPHILKHYDLPELVPALESVQVFVINPLDAQQQPLSAEQATPLYAAAIQTGATVQCGTDGGKAVGEAVQRPWPR